MGYDRKRMIIILILMTAGMTLGLAGCGSKVYAPRHDALAEYEWGTLKASTNHTLANTYEATIKALSDLELGSWYDRRDDIAAEIIARDAQGDVVTINLEALPESRTQLKIRVSRFGDKNKSEVVFNHIMEHLEGG